MVVNGSIFTMETPNTETFTSLINQLGGLIGSNPDLEDICVSSNAKLWAKYKSFRSTKTYSDEADRAWDRSNAFFGIDIAEKKLSNNKNITLLSYSRAVPLNGYTPPFYKRLRDWNGYNHNAKSGILLENHGSINWNSDITLKTSSDTGDNVTFRDLFQAHGSPYYIKELDKFQWTFIDWFGFTHPINGEFSDQSAILDYLYNNNSHYNINLKNSYYVDSSAEYMHYNAIPYISDIASSGYLGLLGWNSSSPNNQYLLNTKSFSFSMVNNKPVINGFCPDMIIGTAAQGKGYLRDYIYDNAPAIKCAKDDFLFLGISFRSVDTAFNMNSEHRKIKIYYINKNLNQLPKSLSLSLFNKTDFNHNVPTNIAVGTTSPSEGGLTTNWAQGMFYIRTSKFWSAFENLAGGIYGGKFAFVYEDFTSIPYKRYLLTPYIELKFQNINKTVESLAGGAQVVFPENNLRPTDPDWNVAVN